MPCTLRLLLFIFFILFFFELIISPLSQISSLFDKIVRKAFVFEVVGDFALPSESKGENLV